MSFSRVRQTFTTVKAKSWDSNIIFQVKKLKLESIKDEEQYLIKKQCFLSAAVLNVNNSIRYYSNRNVVHYTCWPFLMTNFPKHFSWSSSHNISQLRVYCQVISAKNNCSSELLLCLSLLEYNPIYIFYPKGALQEVRKAFKPQAHCNFIISIFIEVSALVSDSCFY